MATKFDIEKFNGRNFSLWKLKMEVILRKDGCLTAISERLVNFTDDNKWIEMDENAMTNFHLALADEVLSSIEEKKTAKEIWDHLTKLYEVTLLHNKIFLKRKLYTLRIPESTSLIEHLNTLNTLFSQLTSLRSAFLQEENRRKNKEDRQVNLQQAEMLTTMKGRSTERDQSSSHKHGRSKSRSKKNLKCYNCGKKGHLKNDCWSLNKNFNPQGNTAITSDDGDVLCCEASTTLEGRKRYADIWLTDSGATYHMTLRREWFYHYEPVSRGYVYSWNDHALEIVWLGNHQIEDNQKLGNMPEQGMKVLVEQNLLPGLTNVSLTLCEHYITIHSGELSSIKWSGRADEHNLVRKNKSNVEGYMPRKIILGRSSQYRLLFGESSSINCNRAKDTNGDVDWKCKFLGYVDGVKGYRLWDPTAHKVIISRDVVFVEDKLQRKEDDDSAEKSETTQIHVKKEFEQGDSFEAEPSHDEQEPESSEAQTTRQSNRMRRSPNWHSDYVIEEEIEALHKNNTWDLVPLPQGRKPIGNKWVFKIKENSDDKVERYHAIFVVKGYAQKEEQLDIKMTFLHRNLEEEIYILQPEDLMQTLVLISRALEYSKEDLEIYQRDLKCCIMLRRIKLTNQLSVVAISTTETEYVAATQAIIFCNKNDIEKPNELKTTNSAKVFPLLVPMTNFPARLRPVMPLIGFRELILLLSCHVLPGGLSPTWKVAVATKTTITNKALRASLGESRPFLNLKYSTTLSVSHRHLGQVPGWFITPSLDSYEGNGDIKRSLALTAPAR
ncbi:hypothetical protein F3Y22_tig00110788pilonHSYRG00242 [Hibiscus syriacus]|uniref:CCHC-type domain-containing protein n=1 Tax=Hibiscus syriacus TaxID=106335 RepID=A0A6A2ZS60_HIBSY|nr:hypothetical protein F3Y22_tig00110788pilonHSYRG00242 [Hibiscus syriacus]